MRYRYKVTFEDNNFIWITAWRHLYVDELSAIAKGEKVKRELYVSNYHCLIIRKVEMV